jgi:mannose-6-phosphate isomerase
MPTMLEDNILQLFGKIQHYAWGGYNFIPALIGMKPEPGTTYAEYWMGAHTKAPSDIHQSNGSTVSLDRLIEQYPEHVLGSDVAKKYGRLPFLFKILDVREMLSIQVHPTKSEAEKGFARENELGIPLNAPERNYKDDNHKPEVQVALSDFWLLHGFMPESQLYHTLIEIPEFQNLASLFENSGYFGLYKYVMEMPANTVDTLLNPLAKRILPRYDAGAIEETSPDYWAAKAMKEMPGEHYDRGIFSIYLFNLVKLKPGQAQFQDAGIPHALLKGQTLEIMANSDNVIRGGLTPKPIDIPQLLKLVKFRGINSEIIEGQASGHPYEEEYISPSQEFCLSKIHLQQGQVYEKRTRSAEILLNLRGQSIVDGSNKEMPIKEGESFFAFADKPYRVRTVSEEAVLFRAFIP